MYLNEVNILSTRPLADELIEKGAAGNITIDAANFISTEAVNEDALKREILRLSLENRTVVFTSMNAAEIVTGYLDGKKPAWRIFCLGITTRAIVQRYYGASLDSGAASNASSLADEIIGNNVKEVIFFCGDQRRDELPLKLAGNNITVKELVVYKTVFTPHRIARKYNGILFFSPSGVQSFFSVNTVSTDTILFAIGSTTADCIRQHNGNIIVISDLPGKKHLVEKAINYFLKFKFSNEHVKE